MGTSIENLVNSGDISIETILSEAKEFRKNYWIHSSGLVISTMKSKPKILKGLRTGYKRKYLGVEVYDDKGVKEKLLIHRIVALMFIHNEENKQQVNHIDGDTTNNSVDNLEWVTPLENTKHAYATGLSPIGIKCSWAKLTEEQVVNCFTLHLEGVSVRDIIKATGVPKASVYRIINRTSWRHITEPLERATTIPNGSTQ